MQTALDQNKDFIEINEIINVIINNIELKSTPKLKIKILKE